MFLFDSLVATKHKCIITALHITSVLLILEIQNKEKILFLTLPGAKRTPYDRYAPSPGQNGQVSKILIILK